MYEFASAVHKRMYGTVTLLTIMEVMRMIGEYLVTEIQKNKKVEIDKFLNIKVVDRLTFSGKKRKVLRVKEHKLVKNLLHQNPLVRPKEELELLRIRKKRAIERLLAWRVEEKSRFETRRAEWISNRRKKQPG